MAAYTQTLTASVTATGSRFTGDVDWTAEELPSAFQVTPTGDRWTVTEAPDPSRFTVTPATWGWQVTEDPMAPQ